MIHETIRQELEFYFKNNKSIHLTLISGTWLNGKVKEINDNNFILDEERLGDMIILFDKINDKGIMPREVLS